MITSSIIKKSALEGAHRIDAEYYCAVVNTGFEYKLGSEIANLIQYGTSEELNERKQGFPVLRLNEFDDYFAGTPEKYSDKISEEVFRDLKLQKGDVLVCRTNGNPRLVGRAAVVMKDTNFAFASYLFKIRTLKNFISPQTLVVFLNSRYGRQQIEKYLMPSIQSNFSPAKFREIKIPIFTENVQKQVNGLLDEAYTEQQKSSQLYSGAEDLLIQVLGIDEILLDDLTFTTSFSTLLSAHRMDADYFQPKYERLIDAISVEKVPMRTLATRVKQDITSDAEQEYAYTEISDVNAGTGEVVANSVVGKELPANAKIHLFGGELVVSKVRPTRGAVAIIPDEWKKNHIASGAFSVFRITSPLREYLQVVLRSIVGKLQLERPTTGTSYPTVTDTDVENLIIPILSEGKQKEIADLVRQSHESRKKAKELLEEAKRRVEEMIEKG